MVLNIQIQNLDLHEWNTLVVSIKSQFYSSIPWEYIRCTFQTKPRSGSLKFLDFHQLSFTFRLGFSVHKFLVDMQNVLELETSNQYLIIESYVRRFTSLETITQRLQVKGRMVLLVEFLTKNSYFRQFRLSSAVLQCCEYTTAIDTMGH